MVALVDTNILLRLVRADEPNHTVVRDALAQMLSAGTTLCYTAQTIAEFWNVATRPVDQRGGFGLSIPDVERLVKTIEAGMLLLAEETEEAVYQEWRRLVVAHSVSGVQVHDARLVAAMRVHDVEHLLTLNPKDFRQYPGITIVHPSAVLQGF